MKNQKRTKAEAEEILKAAKAAFDKVASEGDIPDFDSTMSDGENNALYNSGIKRALRNIAAAVAFGTATYLYQDDIVDWFVEEQPGEDGDSFWVKTFARLAVWAIRGLEAATGLDQILLGLLVAGVSLTIIWNLIKIGYYWFKKRKTK